jgi:hypothetical protein
MAVTSTAFPRDHKKSISLEHFLCTILPLLNDNLVFTSEFQKNLKGYAMNNKPKSISTLFALAVAAGLAASAISSHAQSATATLSGVAAGGGAFDYTLTLNNTSATAALNAFWYGWTLSGNNLPFGDNPTSATNSLGWVNQLDNNSIQWVNLTGTPLAPGTSTTFSFVSTATPSAISTFPSGQSVAYETVLGIEEDAQNEPGVASQVFSPTLVAAPEPSSVSLLVVGSLGLLAAGWRKRRAKSCA